MIITPASAAKTARIVALRDSGMGWRAIGTEVGLSAMACSYRYRMAHGVDERRRRKRAEALVEALTQERNELARQLAELRQIVGAETPIAAITLAQTWYAEKAMYLDQLAGLRAQIDPLGGLPAPGYTEAR